MVSSTFPNPDDPLFSKEWQEMASLTGYKPTETEAKQTTLALVEPGSSEPPERVLMDDDDDLEEDEDEETKIPLHQNPFAKLFMALALVGAGVGSIGLFLATANGRIQQATTPQSSADADSTQTTADPQSSEIGRVKTLNGLGTQAQILNQANQTTFRQNPTAKPGDAAKPGTTSSAKPVASTATPTPMPVPPRRLPVQPIPAAPAPLPVMRSASPQLASAAFQSSAPTVDPMQQWEAAKNLGSYGAGSPPAASMAIATTTAPMANSAVPVSTVSQPLPFQPVAQAPTVVPPEIIPSPAVAPSVPTTDVQYQADVQALMTGVAQPVAQVTPGATATGTLRTPIAWSQDLDSAQQPQRVIIELAQDIPAADGSIAIPAGSQIVGRLTATSQDGMAQIEAQQAIVKTSTGVQTIELPPVAIQITGQDGNPLIAERHRVGGDGHSLGDDLEVVAMGALGRVGELLNRPQNESTMTSPYLSSTNVTNGRTNIMGGLLEGGFSALLQSAQQRQQSRQQDQTQSASVWVIPAGKTVQVYVIDAIQVRTPASSVDPLSNEVVIPQ